MDLASYSLLAWEPGGFLRGFSREYGSGSGGRRERCSTRESVGMETLAESENGYSEMGTGYALTSRCERRTKELYAGQRVRWDAGGVGSLRHALHGTLMIRNGG